MRPASKLESLLLLLAVALLTGCTSLGYVPLTPAATGGANTVYVTSTVGGVNLVLQFPARAVGVVQPIAELQVGNYIQFLESVTVDNFGNIYVAGRDKTVAVVIVEYPAGSGGGPLPSRILSLGATAYLNPVAMTTDAAGTLYVATDTSILVFPLGATAPSRTISGPATQLVEIDGITIDPKGTLYVTNGVTGPGNVLAFAPGADGNVAPSQVISGINGAPLYDPSGIAIAPNGSLYVSAFTGSSFAATGVIYQLASTATGSAVSPITSLYGTTSGFASLRFDAAGDLFAVSIVRTSATSVTPTVVVYGPNSTGTAAPATTYTSPAWADPNYGQIGLD